MFFFGSGTGIHFHNRKSTTCLAVRSARKETHQFLSHLAHVRSCRTNVQSPITAFLGEVRTRTRKSSFARGRTCARRDSAATLRTLLRMRSDRRASRQILSICARSARLTLLLGSFSLTPAGNGPSKDKIQDMRTLSVLNVFNRENPRIRRIRFHKRKTRC